MIEVRWHGRGGQGVVTSSELLALAAIKEGKYVYHAPEFGPERRGAPVRAYTRIDDEPIDQHYGIYNPSAVVVIDPSLVEATDYILAGVREGGTLVINARSPPGRLIERASKLKLSLWYVDAYSIAMDIFGRPFYNTPMLGAFVKASGIVSLDSVLDAIRDRFSGRGEEIVRRNIQAVELAFNGVSRYEY